MNSGKTVPGDSADSLVATRESGSDRILVEGTMAIGAPPETTFVSVRDPAMHLLACLRERLAARGIEFEGALRAGPVTGPVRLGSIGRGIGEAMGRINAVSDNLGAESLLKVLAARLTGEPGSARRGLGAVSGYLAGIGVPGGSTILADGSGVSWYNAVSASDVVAVLLDQRARASTFPFFRATLARPGFPGTLSTRLAGGPAEGRIAAKTGTLTGVSAISGYLVTLSNDELAFSIILNHYPGRQRELRALQDAILNDLVLVDLAR